MFFLLESIVFGFHVKLQGCRISGEKTLLLKSKHVLHTEIIRSSFFHNECCGTKQKLPTFWNPGRLQGGPPPKKKKLLNLGWIRKNPQKIGFQNNISFSNFIRQFMGLYIYTLKPHWNNCFCWEPTLVFADAPQNWRGYRVSQSPGGPTSINLSWNEVHRWGWISQIPGSNNVEEYGKIRQVPISTCFCWYLLYMEYDFCIYMENLHLDFFIYCVTCV